MRGPHGGVLPGQTRPEEQRVVAAGATVALGADDPRRAVALDPNRSVYHRFLSTLHGWAGRPADELREARVALETDPLNPYAHVAMASGLYANGRYDEAARIYREAAAIEGKITYMEPPWWYYPVNQSLGAALYRAGKYDEARDAFMAALASSPNNGWALYGLAETERAQKRSAQAAAADAALARTWAGDRRWLRMDRL